MRHIFECKNGDVSVTMLEDNNEILVKIIDMDTGYIIGIKRFPTIDQARAYAYKCLL